MRKLLFTALVFASTACVEYKPNPNLNPSPSPSPTETKTPQLLKFEANPLTVVAGNPVTISWKVADAEKLSVQILGGATIVPDTLLLEGSLATPAINANTTFVITATNKDKTATAQAMVTVTQVAVPTRAVITSFDLTPQAVTAGAMTTLKWQTTEAIYGTIKANGTLIYTIPTTDLANGQFMQSPGADTTYTIEIKGTDNEPVVLTRALTVTTGAMGLTARELFDRNVAPILAANCASCHAGANPGDGPDYLGPTATPATGFYAPLTTGHTVIGNAPFIAYPSVNSPLVYKGAHTGPAFTTADAATVSSWLVKEAEERGLVTAQNPNNPPPTGNYQPKNLREAIIRFTACMQRTTWDATYGQGNNTQVARQNTNDGPCYACHSTGTAGAFLSQNSGDTFDAHKNPNMIYVMKMVLGTVNTDGSFKDLVPAYRFRDKGQGPQGTPPHPSYLLTDERNQAMNSFIDQTMTRFHDYTNPCTP
ncbi:MAG: hypothetical protein U1E65_02455 [Myxococcota bacterium]